MATLTDWDDTQLGPRASWSRCLESYAKILEQTEGPAAIFWGLELTLISNDAWTKLEERREWHGKPQQHRLCKEAVDALRGTIKSLPPRRVSAEQILGKWTAPREEQFTVILSPLPDHKTSQTRGVLAQLFPIIKDDDENSQRQSKDDSTTDKEPAGKHRHEPKDLTKSDGQGKEKGEGEPFLYRFAELLPAGLAILNKDADVLHVNQPFRDLTTKGEDDDAFNAWPKSIHLDDYDRVMDLYNDAFRLKRQLSCEFRARHNPTFWRLLLVNPLSERDLRDLGLHDSNGFVCNIVDISAEKNAEHAQRKAKTQAEERKEQQERFIDMISHEIRNPLSAVLHCAEDILELVKDNKDGKVDIEEIIEAAETISLCVSHQKHIVDDVLSFSKIDASMLSLSPHPVQARRDIAQSLKIFQVELKKENLQFEFEIDVSYEKIHVDWVMADLTRIGQVLTNLVSNAIKFTRPSKGDRQITVSMGASAERPTSYPPSVVFFDPDDQAYRMDATVTSEWGNGETLYILIAVKDTGIGISQEGQTKLFQRFRQATPKTEEIYGGSGLGLSISRKLCHLHGGEIGVSSIEGKGSTFGFFFRVRRTDSPDVKPKPELAELRDDAMKEETERLGHEVGGETEDADIPESLENPQVANVPEAASVENETSRTRETLKAADKADEAERDLYAVSGRSESHSHQNINHMIERSPLPPRRASFGDSKLLKNVSREGSAAYDKPKTSRQQKRVLLVEDNVINQRILARKLGHKGYLVTPANNGREAVDLFRSTLRNVSNPETRPSASVVQEAEKEQAEPPEPFDVILMDQEMPVLDGNGASREIRALEDGRPVPSRTSSSTSHPPTSPPVSTAAANINLSPMHNTQPNPNLHAGSVYTEWREHTQARRIPILGVTANARDEQKEEMVRAGMDRVIHKPYKIEAMIERIEELTPWGGKNEPGDGQKGNVDTKRDADQDKKDGGKGGKDTPKKDATTSGNEETRNPTQTESTQTEGEASAQGRSSSSNRNPS